MESPIYLDVPGNMGSEGLTFGSNPIDYSALHAFRVISPRTTGALLDLLKRSNDDKLKYTGTYQFRYGHHALFGRGHEVIFKIWHHLH